MPVSLRSLSDHDILSRTRALTIQEREITLLVLLYLNEIERRKLHLKQGYRSMFDYCTSGLGYSASAAMRRIRTARCVARFPEVHGLLESNEVNLSTVSQVSRILTAENRAGVLRRICGKSQREVEAIVAEHEPRAAIPPDRVRTVVVQVPVGTTPPVAPEPVSSFEENHNRSGCVPDPRVLKPACPGGDAGATRLEQRTVIQFSASEAFMAKLEKVRSLAWHRLPANASFEQVFELVFDSFIAH